MNIKQYFMGKDIFPATSIDNIETYRDPQDKRRKLAIDHRSYQKDGMWYVHPISVSAGGASIDIICPYCGQIHRHGNAEGHRISHCHSNNNPGYVIVIGDRRYGK